MVLKQRTRLTNDPPLIYAKALTKKLPNYRFIIYGEYVRDRLLQLKPKKIDIFTSAPIDLIQTTLEQNVIPSKHLLISRNSIATTTKDEIGLVIEHCPLKLMKRRANTYGVFTINTILYDIRSNNFIYSAGSLADFYNKIIKTSSAPEDTFKDKPATMVDACGLLAINYSMVLGETTQIELEKKSYLLETSDRTQLLHIKMSLLKIMEYQIPSHAYRKLYEVGILKIILPELAATVGIIQNRHHNIYYCKDCNEFYTLNNKGYQKWDTNTIKDDTHTKQILHTYSKG